MEEKTYVPISPISDEDKEALKRLTAFYMPDVPLAHGMKPTEIKAMFWQAFLHGDTSMVGFFNRAIGEFNVALATLYETYGDTISAKEYAKSASDAATVAQTAKRDAERAASSAKSAESAALSYKNESAKLVDALKGGMRVSSIFVDPSTYYLTITLENGESFTAKTSLRGPQGDGATLKEEDKQEIVSTVLSALPAAEGGSF